MEENGQGPNGTKTNARSTDSLKSLAKHLKLQPWQANVLQLLMEEPEALTRLHRYGQKIGKSQMKVWWLEYIRMVEEETREVDMT